MSDRRLRAAYVVPMAGGVVGAIVAAGVAAGVALSGGRVEPVSTQDTEAAATTTAVPDDDTGSDQDASGGTAATAADDRPAPLDVQVLWDGTAIAFAGVAQSDEQVDSLGSDAPGSVDVASPGAVTADDDVAAFGTFVEALPDAFVEVQVRLTVDSLTLTGTLAPGVTEADVVAEIDDVGLGGLTQQLDLSTDAGA